MPAGEKGTYIAFGPAWIKPRPICTDTNFRISNLQQVLKFHFPHVCCVVNSGIRESVKWKAVSANKDVSHIARGRSHSN